MPPICNGVPARPTDERGESAGRLLDDPCAVLSRGWPTVLRAERRFACQSVEDLAGVGQDQRIGVSRPTDFVNGSGVGIVKVDSVNDLRRNASGEGDPNPLAFSAYGIVCPFSKEVSRMGQFAPGMIPVAIPVGEEIVAAVIAELDKPWVHGCHLGNVRRIEHDLAAVGNDGLYLVKALGASPQIGISSRHD